LENLKTTDSTTSQAGHGDGHEEGGTPFFPDHFVKEMSVMALIFGVVLFLATLMPMPVGEPANALKTPAGIKPEWYFMTVYQMLKYVPKSAGLVFSFVIFPPVMMLFPFFYNWYSKYKYGRLIMHTIVALGVLVAIFLAMLAYLGFE
jgi:quinol-cytochrome oxidoreductase complex cytochrome b subunit